MNDKPESAYEHYRQLLTLKGIGEKAAWIAVCAEKKWWNRYNVQVRDCIIDAGLTERQALMISELVKDNSLQRYRISRDSYDECIINPWTVMIDVTYYTLDDADKLAKFEGINLDSPDRLAEIVFIALDDVINNKKNKGDTYVSKTQVRDKFNSLTDNKYKFKSRIYQDALTDLQSQDRIVVF
jgi:hypothetical protein